MKKIIIALALVGCSKQKVEQCKLVTMTIANTYTGTSTTTINDQKFCDQSLKSIRKKNGEVDTFYVSTHMFFIKYFVTEK